MPIFRQERTFLRALGLFIGELFVFARHTVTQELLALGLTDADWSPWYRLFSRKRFDPEQASQVLFNQTLPHVSADQPYVIGVDGVQVPRSSQKMPGTNWLKAPRTPPFRYADDAASGAVQISAPATVRVPANGKSAFNVKVKVDVSKLPIWDLNGGARGGDGYRLQGFEFDGYINIQDATDSIKVAWQILPHRSAEVTPASESVTLSGGVGTLTLLHTGGALDGRVDVFSLLGTSGRIPPPLLPKDGDNYAIIDLKNFGARLVSVSGLPAVQFAINTFGTRAHPNYPAEFDVYIDNNLDGVDDFVIYNLENGGFGATGQNVVRVYNLLTGASVIRFFSDADLNSGNIIFTALLSDLGLTPTSQFRVSVYACDNYFTGTCTDAIESMLYTAGMPRYYPDNYAPVVPQGDSTTLTITALPGGETASPSQMGMLLMYRDARQQREADAIYVYP